MRLKLNFPLISALAAKKSLTVYLCCFFFLFSPHRSVIFAFLLDFKFIAMHKLFKIQYPDPVTAIHLNYELKTATTTMSHAKKKLFAALLVISRYTYDLINCQQTLHERK